VSLTWTAPTSNGGSTITDYVVEQSSDGGRSWTTFSDGTSATTAATVMGLTNGKGYVFRVSAVNAVGTGPASARTGTVTPRSVAAAPTAVVATPGNAQVGLTWTAPASNGGATITDYVIQLSSDGGRSWTTFSDATSANRSATVTGLTNGRNYVFRVAAVNAVGTGPASARTGTVTPRSVAAAPTAVVATRGDAQVTLAWTAPASSGGASITDYLVQYSSNNGTNWSTFNDGTSTNRSATVTGLVNGLSYVFRVSAVNVAGVGPASTNSAPVTLLSVGGAPSAVMAAPGNAQVSLTWTAPSSNGGSAIADYVVQYSGDGGRSWTTFNDGESTNTAATVMGLTNGKGYVFRVSAVNAVGTGPTSARTGTVYPLAVTPSP
jgi:predicted phage tail protein